MNKEYGGSFNLSFKKQNDYYFVSGRIALKKILKCILFNNDKCLIPNFLCESIHNCFNCYDYYKIDNDLNINFENIETLLIKNTYKSILIINFFGNIDKNIQDIVDICKREKIIIIEDFTHNIYDTESYGDISLCSYRKSLDVPFGCLVNDKYKLMNIDQKNTFDFYYIFINFTRIVAMILKNYYFLKNIWYPLLIFSESKIDNITYEDFDYINYLFYRFSYDINDKNKRIDNYNELKNNILNCETIKSNNSLYFIFPLIFETKNKRDNVRNYLIKNKIYCPMYWNMDFDKHNLCNKFLYDNILYIPIDQRYNIDDMKYIACKINTINNNI